MLAEAPDPTTQNTGKMFRRRKVCLVGAFLVVLTLLAVLYWSRTPHSGDFDNELIAEFGAKEKASKMLPDYIPDEPEKASKHRRHQKKHGVEPDIPLKKKPATDPPDEEEQAELRRREAADRRQLVKRARVVQGGSQHHHLLHGDKGREFVEIAPQKQKPGKNAGWEAGVFGDNAFYRINTVNLPPAQYLPEIGNGHLGTVVFSENVHVSGLYAEISKITRRASIPAWIIRNLTSVTRADTKENVEIGRRYMLDVSQGVFTQVIAGRGWTVEQRVYAHRNFSALLVHEVDIQRWASWSLDKLGSLPDRYNPKGGEEVYKGTLRVHLPKERRSEVSGDVTFLEQDHPSVRAYGNTLIHKHGHTPMSDETGEMEVHAFYTPVPDYVVIPSEFERVKVTFLMAVHSDETIARQHFRLGLDLIESTDLLYDSHLVSWRSVWEHGSVAVEKEEPIARALLAAQYYLWSSLPYLPPLGVGEKSGGISADGLARNEWSGVVSWDQELWIIPPLTLLQPGMARHLLQYRLDRIEAARKNAQHLNLRGLRFPVESAVTGNERSNNSKLAGSLHHVTGDVVLAFINYILTTNDTALLSSPKSGNQLLRDAAKFWLSLAKEVSSSYHFLDTLGLDCQTTLLRNPLFTNALAWTSLRGPATVHKFAYPNTPLPSELAGWFNQSDKIHLPYSSTRGSYLMHEDYQFGNRVCYIEPAMLAYPIDHMTDLEVLRKTLLLYVEAMQDSPSMSHAINAINLLEVKDVDRAWASFKQQFMFIRAPFFVWSEFSSGGRANHLPAAGAFLQSVLFGYLGIRVRPKGLYLEPQRMPKVARWRVTGLHYLGAQIDIEVEATSVKVTLMQQGTRQLTVKSLGKGGQLSLLQTGRTVHLDRTRLVIRASTTTGERVQFDWGAAAQNQWDWVGTQLEQLRLAINRAWERGKTETESRGAANQAAARPPQEVVRILQEKQRKKEEAEKESKLEDRAEVPR